MKRSKKIFAAMGAMLALTMVLAAVLTTSTSSEKEALEAEAVSKIEEFVEPSEEEAKDLTVSDTVDTVEETTKEKATRPSVNNSVVENDTYDNEPVVVADTAQYDAVISTAKDEADKKAEELIAEIPTEATEEVEIGTNESIKTNIANNTSGTARKDGKYSQLHSDNNSTENNISSEA